MDPAENDAAKTEKGRPVELTVALALLALILMGCFLVLKPFLTAILWAVLLCFSTWELYDRLRRILGGRKSLAALVMTLLLAAVAILPFVTVGEKLADNVADVSTAIARVAEQGPPQPPQWVEELPLVGAHLHDYLTRLANDSDMRRAAMHDLVGLLRGFAVAFGKSLGSGILEISLSLFICFFLFRDADALAARFDTIVSRIAGARGRHLVGVARVTVSGVVHGIIGTALIEGVLFGIGYWIVGVPGAFFLAFATFLLAFVPMGPALLWIPAAVWLFGQASTERAVFFIIWAIVMGSAVEQVLKPVIISRTGTTPVILVMLGVFGGALAFGFIGVFIGPTLLAVVYSLIDEWSVRFDV